MLQFLSCDDLVPLVTIVEEAVHASQHFAFIKSSGGKRQRVEISIQAHSLINTLSGSFWGPITESVPRTRPRIDLFAFGHRVQRLELHYPKLLSLTKRSLSQEAQDDIARIRQIELGHDAAEQWRTSATASVADALTNLRELDLQSDGSPFPSSDVMYKLTHLQKLKARCWSDIFKASVLVQFTTDILKANSSQLAKLRHLELKHSDDPFVTKASLLDSFLEAHPLMEWLELDVNWNRDILLQLVGRMKNLRGLHLATDHTASLCPWQINHADRWPSPSEMCQIMLLPQLETMKLSSGRGVLGFHRIYPVPETTQHAWRQRPTKHGFFVHHVRYELLDFSTVLHKLGRLDRLEWSGDQRKVSFLAGLLDEKTCLQSMGEMRLRITADKWTLQKELEPLIGMIKTGVDEVEVAFNGHLAIVLRYLGQEGYAVQIGMGGGHYFDKMSFLSTALRMLHVSRLTIRNPSAGELANMTKFHLEHVRHLNMLAETLEDHLVHPLIACMPNLVSIKMAGLTGVFQFNKWASLAKLESVDLSGTKLLVDEPVMLSFRNLRRFYVDVKQNDSRGFYEINNQTINVFCQQNPDLVHLEVKLDHAFIKSCAHPAGMHFKPNDKLESFCLQLHSASVSDLELAAYKQRFGHSFDDSWLLRGTEPVLHHALRSWSPFVLKYVHVDWPKDMNDWQGEIHVPKVPVIENVDEHLMAQQAHDLLKDPEIKILIWNDGVGDYGIINKHRREIGCVRTKRIHHAVLLTPYYKSDDLHDFHSVFGGFQAASAVQCMESAVFPSDQAVLAYEIIATLWHMNPDMSWQMVCDLFFRGGPPVMDNLVQWYNSLQPF